MEGLIITRVPFSREDELSELFHCVSVSLCALYIQCW
jgi:hypothetical protein